MLQRIILSLLACCALWCAACDDVDHPATVVAAAPASNTAPIPSPVVPTAPARLVVTHIDTQVHSYAVAPAWFVRVDYDIQNSPYTVVVVEETAVYNGQAYGTVRALDLSQHPEYDAFYDGAAPSGRKIRVYPAEVSGANWHNGVAWLNEHPWPNTVMPWHLDISWPDIYLNPKAGHIVAADHGADVSWSIDVTNTTVVTVSIP